jgi:hypothetical protein
MGNLNRTDGLALTQARVTIHHLTTKNRPNYHLNGFLINQLQSN